MEIAWMSIFVLVLIIGHCFAFLINEKVNVQLSSSSKISEKKKRNLDQFPRRQLIQCVTTTLFHDDNNFPSPRNFSNLIRRSYHHLAPPVSSSFWYLKKENFYGAFRPSPSPSIRILILFFFFLFGFHARDALVS